MLFSHNPGLTDFVNTLMNGEIDIDNVPTCGVVAFQFDVDSMVRCQLGKRKNAVF